MTRRTLPLVAALFALVTACAPTQTAPDLTGSPLQTGQVWKMQTPAGPSLLERKLTVGERTLQADGTVAYLREPVPTLTGSSEDVFRFVPQGEGRGVVLAGRAEQSFDIRFYDFCAVYGGSAERGSKQTGVYFKSATLEGLLQSRVYRAFLQRGGKGLELPACTLERVQ